jgi:hypothetical protein
MPDSTRHLHFDGSRLGLYVSSLVLLATLLATTVDGRFRYPALGLAAGLFYGALDSSTKGLADLARVAGVGAVITSPFLFLAIGAGVAAFFCFQRALQTSRPLTAIAVMEAGATGGGVLAGFVAFGDSLGASPGIELIHLAAFLGVGIAALTLAPAQTRLVDSAEPASALSGTTGAGSGRVEPAPGVAEGGGHLGTPQPPVVYSRGLRGTDRDPQAP